MSDLKIDADIMKTLMAKTIIDSLTTEHKDALFAKAIEHILKEQVSGDGYNKRTYPAPLQEAFNRASEQVANQVARERLENDSEFKAHVERLFTDVTKKLFEEPIYNGLVEKIAKAVSDGLEKSNRY